MARINLHPVEKGRVYRTGRLESADFEKAVTDLGIKSLLRVICLQRNNRDYFKRMGAICERLGVTVHAVSLQHNRAPDKKVLQRIIEVFDTTDYPLLIMCHRGADRSGLTSALYKMYTNRPRKEVEGQLRLIPYGHVSLMHPQFHIFLRRLFDEFGGDLKKYLDSDEDLSR